jgi:hypothetical protein
LLFYQDDDPGRGHGSSGSYDGSGGRNIQNNAAMSAIGHNLPYGNEYDRDAEFYRRRNLEYYSSGGSSSSNINNINNFGGDSTAAGPQHSQNAYHRDEREPVEETINTVIKSSRSSFKNVESLTVNLLNRRPFVAIGLFGASLMVAAYLTGFFILDGYIDNWNPAVNDQVPYWDEPEIHTIMRR